MRRLYHELFEAVRIAFAQISANKLRSMLTMLGVIIGIVAVTLMGTAILGIDAGVESSLAGFGDDVLYVSKRPWGRSSGDSLGLPGPSIDATDHESQLSHSKSRHHSVSFGEANNVIFHMFLTGRA